MKNLLLFTALSVALSACGGGGGGAANNGGGNADPVSGLNLPKTISIVTAQPDEIVIQSKVQGKTSAVSPFSFSVTLGDAGTDYMTDPSQSYVYDASMSALDTVNMIMCLLEQTRATDMVNAGAYIALVNEDKCEQGQGGSGETGQSTVGAVTQFNSWTVNSTRANNTADQIVQIWVPGETGGDVFDSQTILVEITVSEGVSESLPFGRFAMNFKGVVDTQGGEETTMLGSLNTVANIDNKPQFEFVNVGGAAVNDTLNLNFSFEESANVILDDATGTSGRALTKTSDTYMATTEVSSYAIAFNDSNLLRGLDVDGNAAAEVCKSRTNFDSQVWRYNLYHNADGTFQGQTVTAGQRVELFSGFSFTYGVNGAYGWIGYNGLWSETNELGDGDTITQFDNVNDTTIDHTVNISNGKMMRRQALSAPLSSFVGKTFEYSGPHPTLEGLYDQWQVTIDSNNDFQITGVISWGNNGQEISTTVDDDYNPATNEVPVAAGLTLANNKRLSFWSESLGGNVDYVQDDAVLAANRTVTYYGNEVVNPTDAIFANGAVTLYCYDNCLIGGLTQTDVNNASSSSELFYVYSGTAFEYTLSSGNGKIILTDSLNDADVSAASLNMIDIGNEWGINTGVMVTTAVDATQPWLIYEAAVTYSFETGMNDWNRMVTVVNNANGEVTTFAPPLQFDYTHSTANDANANAANDGAIFFLEYAGPGNLWGFPSVEDAETGRWYTEATLKDGITLTDVNDNTFVVKAMESEQSMQDDNNGGCASLSVAGLSSNTALALPTVNDIGNVSAGMTLAAKPDVTDAPAVIEGELQ